MVNSDENNLMLSSSMVILQDETRRGNRRALGVINQNLVAARPYPCVVNKRGSLSEREHKGCEKKKIGSLNPSISRCQDEKETKKLKPSNPNINNFGDCIFIDEDEEEDDKAMPMSLEESYIEESDPMEEEIEMEDIMLEEPILNIDDQDANNPLAVVEYIEDLYRFYRETESLSCVPQDYMTRQSDITGKMRAILIDWLIEVHDKFELLNETLFLTVNLIDRFLSKQSIARKSLQLVGLVALLLACKYEEVSVPIVEDLVIISDNAYTRKDVLEMEKIMLNTLQFKVSLPTQYPFLKRFLKAAQSNVELEMMAKFLMELALVDYEMLRYPPSLLAATAVYTAQCTVLRLRQWNRTCEFYTHYSQDQLLECSKKMVNLHQKAGIDNLKGVYRKYDSSKFGNIAIRYEAAHFLV